jgi:hypothetical protein
MERYILENHPRCECHKCTQARISAWQRHFAYPFQVVQMADGSLGIAKTTGGSEE